MCFNTLKIHCNFTLAKKNKYRFKKKLKAKVQTTLAFLNDVYLVL